MTVLKRWTMASWTMSTVDFPNSQLHSRCPMKKPSILLWIFPAINLRKNRWGSNIMPFFFAARFSWNSYGILQLPRLAETRWRALKGVEGRFIVVKKSVVWPWNKNNENRHLNGLQLIWMRCLDFMGFWWDLLCEATTTMGFRIAGHCI